MKGFKTVALFGEAQRGAFLMPHYIESVETLVETLGAPPKESLGLEYAIQTLHYKHSLIYLRVREEGFNIQDYYEGLWLLQAALVDKSLLAVGIPGVGSREIIDSMANFCLECNSLLLISEPDLYDYLVA